ncbi:MAG: DUF92 domain-containing protein [Oscillospiraceae bacterium]|nr:DUF92 domain-containing protein [Oscillospiraceae bacterium]
MLFQLIMALILSSALAGFAIWKHALTPAGVALAWLCAMIITYTGGVGCFCVLAATLVFALISGKLSKKQQIALGRDIHAKPGKRDSVQVFCNVGIGSILLIIYAITEKSLFMIAYACVMASSLADSMASELGVLSTRRPIDICTFKKTEKGLSGGVTLLGLGTSLLGGILIALVFCLTTRQSWQLFLFISLCGFLGALIDSVLGSCLQVKYNCPVCGIQTEKRTHCGKKTLRYKGWDWITNDFVNFCNNAFVAIFAVVVLAAI